MEQSFEKAFDITADLAVGDVDIRALQEENQFIMTGLIIGQNANDCENVQGVLAGMNTNIIINFLGKYYLTTN